MSQFSRHALTLRVLATAVLAAGVLTLTMGVASGRELVTEDVQSGDSRATAYPGNVQMYDCAQAGLTGEGIEVDADIKDNTYLTPTALASGFELTGVVVKGGPAYNVYSAASTGSNWTDLHAPLNPSGGPAQISHWFACGIATGETTPGADVPAGNIPVGSLPVGDDTSGDVSSGATGAGGEAAAGEADAEGDSSGEGDSAGEDDSADETPTTTPASGSGGASESGTGLADTGVSAGGMLFVAGLLVLAGAGLVLATRRGALSGVIKTISRSSKN